MRNPADILDRIASLKAEGEAFCLATVIRTVAATAAKAGAKAVIRADGTISDGWIGGGCARGAVLKAARDALADGQPRLVSVMPKDLLGELGITPGHERDGVSFARNMCPSRGTMDIFIEPMLPQPNLVIFGASPVAAALAELAPGFGYRITVYATADEYGCIADPAEPAGANTRPAASAGRRFVVVSTQGRGDEPALRAALSISADHVCFVGSGLKVTALRQSLLARGVLPESFDRLKAPAGLDLGAITPEEIALSILAEILAVRRRGQRAPAQPHNTTML